MLHVVRVPTLRQIVFLLLSGLISAPAAAASSTIDPTYPATNDDIDAFGLRNQFQAAHDDITNIGAVTSLSANQLVGALTSGPAIGINIPSCSGSTPILHWTAGAGFACVAISGGSGSGITAITGDLTCTGTGSVSCALANTPQARTDLGLGTSNNTFSGTNNFTGPLQINGVNTAASATTDTTNAANIASGTLPLARIAANLFTSSLAGIVPSSGGGTSNFLRADGTWVTPPGAASTALSSLAPGTTSNTIDSTSNAQSWAWNSLTTQTALSLSSTSQTTGTLLNLSSPSTATGPALNVTGRMKTSQPCQGCSGSTIVYPETYGALGNDNSYFDGVFTAPSSLTSATANFAASNVGNPICVEKVGSSSTQMCGTISAVNSATSVTVSFTGTVSGSSRQFAFGTDDSTAFTTMLTTAPCSTVGCTVQLQNKHYALTVSLTLPPNIPISFYGYGPGVPNTTQHYLPGFSLVNKNNGTQLQWLTKSLTAAAITMGGTAHITNSTTQDYLANLALYGGVGIGMDGGGADGVDVLNWQGGLFNNVYVFNFTGWGTYIDGMTASNFNDYIENIDMQHYYVSFNGSGGIKVGSSRAVANVETTSCEWCVLEGNGGPAINLAGNTIQGFQLLSSTIQWNNLKGANPEILTSGLVSGGLIASNYIEVDTNFGSQSTSAYGTSTGNVGITYLANFYFFASSYTPLAFSAAGTAIPSCAGLGNVTGHNTATVSDSTACTIGTTYTSGGSTRCNVQCNGTNWIETGAASF